MTAHILYTSLDKKNPATLSKNIIKNTKLYIFQHGDGGIFTDNDFYNTGWDKKICDKFLFISKLIKKFLMFNNE